MLRQHCTPDKETKRRQAQDHHAENDNNTGHINRHGGQQTGNETEGQHAVLEQQSCTGYITEWLTPPDLYAHHQQCRTHHNTVINPERKLIRRRRCAVAQRGDDQEQLPSAAVASARRHVVLNRDKVEAAIGKLTGGQLPGGLAGAK